MPKHKNSLPTFVDALNAWKTAARDSIAERFSADKVHHRALLASKETTQGLRDADASLASAAARLVAQNAWIEERCAYHLMIHLRDNAAVVDHDPDDNEQE